MVSVSQVDLAKFAEIVARAWSDPQFFDLYRRDPNSVLQENGINLPAGVPIPVIPELPPNVQDTGSAFRSLTFDNWALAVGPNKSFGPENVSIAVSSLACAACPVSCFSSISN